MRPALLLSRRKPALDLRCPIADAAFRQTNESRSVIAEDLGVGLSTLRHWIDRRREHQIDHPPADRQEDMVAELKRLRRENEILRQEREILKRATAFFAKEGSR